jgi:hypothetical protein
MSIAVALAIYTSLIAFVSSIMVYYYKMMYPREEAKLMEKSK